MQHQNQANFINTQTGCTDTQPAWGDPCSWVAFELWGGQRENAAKPTKGAVLTMKLSCRQNKELAAGWNQDGANTGRVAPRLHVAQKRVVCAEQLAGFICSTFSDPEKQPGSLLALSLLSDVPFSSFMINSPRRDFRENAGLKYSKYSRVKSGIFRIPAGSLANQVSHIHPSLMMIIMHQQLSTVQWMRI